MYTLDTNAILYYIENDPNVVFVVEDIFRNNIPVYISAITELELFSFTNLNIADEERIENFIKIVTVIPVESQIARRAGALRAQYKLKTPDSAIAATAILTGSQLVTRNIKDFRKVPHLRLLKI